MKKYFVPAAALIVAVFMGCAKHAPDMGKKITLFTWVPLDEYRVNQELIKEFEKDNPGVKVAYINMPEGNAMARLQVLFAGGSAPDVMSLHGAYFLQFAAKGLLMPLEEFMSTRKDLKLADFYPKMIDGCRYEGKLYSLPRYTSVYVLFYNKDLFDRERLPYPSYGWTWEKYLSDAIALTKDTNGDGRIDQYGCAIDFWGARLYPWIWQNNGKIFDPEKNRCLVDDKNTVDAIQFLVDLKYRYNVTPLALSAEYKSNVELFKVGRVGMFISGAWDIQNLKYENRFSWDIAPLPKKKRMATILGMENYAVSSVTKEKELSYKLLEFLLSKPTQLKMAEKLEKQPSLMSLGNEYARAKPGYDRKVLVDAVDYGIVPTNIRQYNEVYDVLQKQLDLVWMGKKPVKAGLSEAAANINEMLIKTDTRPEKIDTRH
jgi:multiple sugar transport system substrate-binding protein